MLRTLVVVGGALEFLFPDRLVEWGERRAFENPEEAHLRPWTIPMARLEGLAFVWAVLSNRVGLVDVGRLLGPVGVVMILAPRRVLEIARGIAYENAGEIDVKSWVVPATRLLGLAYVLGAWAGSRAGRER